MEQAAASLGGGAAHALPPRHPASTPDPGDPVACAALAFSRGRPGESRPVVVPSSRGTLPFKTEASSVLIAGRIESGDTPGAAALAVVLLVVSLLVLLGMSLLARWGSRHARLSARAA